MDLPRIPSNRHLAKTGAMIQGLKLPPDQLFLNWALLVLGYVGL
jgi:hypothetical protein